jgi:hypothetical protein
MLRRCLTLLLAVAIYLHGMAFSYSQCHLVADEHSSESQPHFHLSALGIPTCIHSQSNRDRQPETHPEGDRRSLERNDPDEDHDGDAVYVSAYVLALATLADWQVELDCHSLAWTLQDVLDSTRVPALVQLRSSRWVSTSVHAGCPLYLRAHTLLI